MKTNEFGRSMIEMLGVLAIIGVLSVGGISGYTEAMRKYKMNKTIEIFRYTLFRIQEIENIVKGSEIIAASDVKQYINAGLFPENICDENYVDVWGGEGISCQLPIGDVEFILAFSRGKLSQGEFYIGLKSKNDVKNCVDFLSYNWQNITPKYWWNNGYIAVNGKDINEININNIANACETCKNTEGPCTINIFLSETNE